MKNSSFSDDGSAPYIANSACTNLTCPNLPNNSFTSIFTVFPSYLLSFRCRCKDVYEVSTDVQGRALWFYKKSSLRPAATMYLFSKTLNVITPTPTSPRNDTTDTTERRIKKSDKRAADYDNNLTPSTLKSASKKQTLILYRTTIIYSC